MLIVQTFKQAWESGLNVSVHGWLYNLSSGLLTDLNMSKHNFA
jgi:carbonic anhydrase